MTHLQVQQHDGHKRHDQDEEGVQVGEHDEEPVAAGVNGARGRLDRREEAVGVE